MANSKHTVPTRPTALAPTAPDPKLPVHLQPTPPAGVPITSEEWAAMPPEERQAALAFLQEETRETTRGVTVTFPRIKYPTSGSSFWEVPTATGEPEATKAIEGVVVYKMPVRAYWPVGAEVGNNPPTCRSRDAIVPDEDSPEPQAKRCAECPYSRFGSGKDGRGQACKQRLNTFVLLTGESLPTLISLPPTALRPFGEYAVQLRKANLPLVSVTTIFGLQDAKSSGGISYKGIALKVGRRLSFAEMKAARAVREAFESAMAQRGIQVEEATEEPAEGNGHAGTQY
ncbi:MAG TPA: hypothetical protein VFE48_25470 [Methylomirabilota bacterium]|nr:hypothetical protein [Methylomirabilota bacterium]